MKDTKELNQFYDEVIKLEGMPEFKDLSEEQIKELSNSYGFAGWRLGNATEKLIQTIKSQLGVN